MKVIWKYDLGAGATKLQIPCGAEVLTVQAQFGDPKLWVLVDPDNTTEVRTFNTYGTGHELPNIKQEYIGTFQIEGGAYIFHVFEQDNF